jgi:sigma-B regulation protein RsbU (phosphoserine phosphatase)
MFKSVTSRLIFWITATTALLFSLAAFYAYRNARDQAILDAERRAVLIAEAEASQVEEVLRSAEEGARLLATTLGHTSASNMELERVIRAFVEGNKRVYGSTIAANPNTRGLYAPYFYKGPDGIARADLATPSYDYPAQEWYSGAAKAGEPRWSEPYFDEGGGNVVMVTYTVPVFTDASKDSFAGVVTADIALEWLAQSIASQSLQGSEYAMVLSRRGDILAHPDRDILKTTTDALRKGERTIDPHARAVADRMLRGEHGFEAFEDPYLGKRVRAVFRPVGGAGWSIGVVYPEDTLLADARRLARLNFFILVFALLALGLVVTAISKRVTRPLRELASSATRMATGDLDAALPAIASNDEIGALTRTFHHMRDSLKEYIRNLEITTREKERHESELKIARDIQMHLLPADRVDARPPAAYHLAASLIPARQVGGDLYDHFLVDRKLWFMVGDVSGKGVGAAVFMARAMTMLRAAAGPGSGPKEILTKVNNGLCQQNNGATFVTLFAAVLDLTTGSLTHASAGHDPPVIVSGLDPRFLETEGGPVLGLIEGAAYVEERTDLKPGDTLIVYTDGVTEAMDPETQLFSRERILEAVRFNAPRSSADVLGALLSSVRAFAGDAPQSDDITVMVVQYGDARRRAA